MALYIIYTCVISTRTCEEESGSIAYTQNLDGQRMTSLSYLLFSTLRIIDLVFFVSPIPVLATSNLNWQMSHLGPR